jgi:hypothetical protein
MGTAASRLKLSVRTSVGTNTTFLDSATVSPVHLRIHVMRPSGRTKGACTCASRRLNARTRRRTCGKGYVSVRFAKSVASMADFNCFCISRILHSGLLYAKGSRLDQTAPGPVCSCPVVPLLQIIPQCWTDGLFECVFYALSSSTRPIR